MRYVVNPANPANSINPSNPELIERIERIGEQSIKRSVIPFGIASNQSIFHCFLHSYVQLPERGQEGEGEGEVEERCLCKSVYSKGFLIHSSNNVLIRYLYSDEERYSLILSVNTSDRRDNESAGFQTLFILAESVCNLFEDPELLI